MWIHHHLNVRTLTLTFKVTDSFWDVFLICKSKIAMPTSLDSFKVLIRYCVRAACVCAWFEKSPTIVSQYSHILENTTSLLVASVRKQERAFSSVAQEQSKVPNQFMGRYHSFYRMDSEEWSPNPEHRYRLGTVLLTLVRHESKIYANKRKEKPSHRFWSWFYPSYIIIARCQG